jgi:hypothetical protein
MPPDNTVIMTRKFENSRIRVFECSKYIEHGSVERDETHKRLKGALIPTTVSKLPEGYVRKIKIPTMKTYFKDFATTAR